MNDTQSHLTKRLTAAIMFAFAHAAISPFALELFVYAWLQDNNIKLVGEVQTNTSDSM